MGVGQSETAVHSMVDFFLLIQLAGTGDELQGIKRGIMEMADGIVINKADGNNIEKAKLAQAHFRNALHLFPPTPSGWEPQVLTYSGYYEIGIAEVWKMIDDYVAFVKANGYFDRRRREQSRYWLTETIDEQLRAHFYQNPDIARAADRERAPRARGRREPLHRRSGDSRPLLRTIESLRYIPAKATIQ